MFDKLIRDFFLYTMNSFDSISQIINAGLLANKSKKVDSVDIQIMVRYFGQQTYSAGIPQGSDNAIKTTCSDHEEHEAARWLTKEELDKVNWLPADVEIVHILKRNM